MAGAYCTLDLLCQSTPTVASGGASHRLPSCLRFVRAVVGTVEEKHGCGAGQVCVRAYVRAGMVERHEQTMC